MENPKHPCGILGNYGCRRHTPKPAPSPNKSPKFFRGHDHESRKGRGANALDLNGWGDTGVSKLGDAQTSAHYSHFKIQPIDFIIANNLGFLEANVIKYVCRYPYKGSALKDLEKARQYVDWLIEREKGKVKP